MQHTLNKKEGGRGVAQGAAVRPVTPPEASVPAEEKNGRAGDAGPVSVRVAQKVPNKRILIVQEVMTGDLAKMRVRDSAHYRPGEIVQARVQPDCWYEPVWHRNRPHIGGVM